VTLAARGGADCDQAATAKRDSQPEVLPRLLRRWAVFATSQTHHQRRDFDVLIFHVLIALGFFSRQETAVGIRAAPHRHTTVGCVYLLQTYRNEFTSHSRRHLLAEEFSRAVVAFALCGLLLGITK
jgi:hypothetical protein